MLSVRDLTHRYGRLPVLRGLRADFDAGRPILLRGANGTGKTTLLRILAGSLRPSEATITWRGEPRPRGQAWRRRVGWAGGACRGYDVLTVAENLAAFARLKASPDPAGDAADALRAFDLVRRADDPLRTLSKGWLQRTKLALAWLGRPEILLLDEPFEGLDADGRARVEARMLAAAADRPVVFAAHDPSIELERRCDVRTLSRGSLSAAT